jgi:hypothetical protein
VSTIHVTCPFPPCTGEWWIGGGPGQTIFEVPFHLPEGFAGAERFNLRCPGALLRPRIDGPDATPLYLPGDVELITRAYERHLLWLALSLDEQAAEQEELDAALDEIERRNRENEPPISPEPPATEGAYVGGPLGRPVDWERPREEYFPGRPADAPEPGPGDPPAGYVPSGVEGIHLTGRDKVDDSHAATLGLTRLALEQHARAQEALSVVTELLERATTMAAVAETHVQSAQSLVISAVGTGAGKPAPGEAMAEQTALAVDTLSGTEGGNLHNAINLAKIRAETAHQQIAGATSNGQAYIGLLGG